MYECTQKYVTALKNITGIAVSALVHTESILLHFPLKTVHPSLM